MAGGGGSGGRTDPLVSIIALCACRLLCKDGDKRGAVRQHRSGQGGRDALRLPGKPGGAVGAAVPRRQRGGPLLPGGQAPRGAGLQGSAVLINEQCGPVGTTCTALPCAF